MPSSAARRQWRRQLKRVADQIAVDIASGKLVDHPVCSYPTCEAPKVTEDCCYFHSIDGNVSGGAFVPNDGIIDWQAIDVARHGERVVGLTWVEYEIAGAYILLDGETQDEMRERTGINCRGGGSRIEKMKEVADALRVAA